MKNQTFYISNFHIMQDEIDTSEIPSSLKRRLSNVDKLALSLFLKSYEENVDEIIFSSNFGEFERLKGIIGQYQEFNEVSPMNFSGSVHNFPTGAFCQLKQINTSYNAVSSGENSISAGLIKGIISENKNVLFCYADVMDSKKGVSLIISKEKLNENSIKCAFLNEKKETEEFEEICRFLNNKKGEFTSSLGKIIRV